MCKEEGIPAPHELLCTLKRRRGRSTQNQLISSTVVAVQRACPGLCCGGTEDVEPIVFGDALKLCLMIKVLVGESREGHGARIM